MSVHTDRLTLITLASRFNEWQGHDAQITPALLGAMIWSLSMDTELQQELNEAVETERRYEAMMRAEQDGEPDENVGQMMRRLVDEDAPGDPTSGFEDEQTAERDRSARRWKQD